TELADLMIVVRLPGSGVTWRAAYREAPRQERPDSPDPEAVLEGAAQLLAAMGAKAAAAMLRRAELEQAWLASAEGKLVRYVIRLDPADLAAALRNADLAGQLDEAVKRAGTRAAGMVASVDLAPALV